MDVRAENIYKRYIGKYIIKDFNYHFSSGQNYGVQGPNGSGKSTLIQILSGYLSPSKGNIYYTNSGGEKIDRDTIYRSIAIAAPYFELDLELTPSEIFDHLKIFKDYRVANTKELLEILRLEGNEHKVIKNFSSGMNQRLILGLALLSDAEIILLDEPTSFLDADSKSLFTELVTSYCMDKTMIIASNDPFDFKETKEIITINNMD